MRRKRNVVKTRTHAMRMAALDRALAEADRRFGPIPASRLAAAEAEHVAAMRLTRKRR
jgi:hypothetical protein